MRIKLGKAELVLAYEMKKAGIRIKTIAGHFGVRPSHLSFKICKCERIGLWWLN